MSTVLDVSIGLLLVGAAAGVIATAPVAPDQTVTERGAPALLGPTRTVDFETETGHWTVEGSVGGLVGRATAAGAGPDTARSVAFREAVGAEVGSYLDTHAGTVQIVGACRGTDSTDPLVIGPAPPGDRPVRGTTYAVPVETTPNATRCDPVVVLRRWSP